MQLHIRTRDPEVRRERPAIDRSVRLALGRHSPAIREVRLAFASPVPISGSEARSCEILVRLADGSEFSARDQAPRLHTAAALAASRLARRLERRSWDDDVT